MIPGVRIALCTMAMVAFGEASAQTYPSKPIHFIVGFPAGSTIDNLSRIVLDDVRAKTGETIILDNKPGALGAIGLDFVAKAAADGYTMMPSSSATNSSGPHLSKSIPYNAIVDFTHIARVARFDIMLVTNPGQGLNSIPDLIAEAKRKPLALTYGYGSGTGQVIASSFSRAAGIEVRGIPYKGQPAALTDLMGGQINFVTADVGALLSLVKSGRLAAIAVASDKRSTILPNVPTLREQGVKDVELAGWIGIAGPARLPAEVITWWTRHLTSAVSQPDVIERVRSMGVEPDFLDGDRFRQFVRAQDAIWGKQIREAGIEPE
jgi:tripartite-type tricarboxylate transporter receptor subunit TctC